MFRSPLRCSLLASVLIPVALGCDSGNLLDPGGTHVDPAAAVLLAPFHGEWTCDIEKTLAAEKAAGATDEEIEQMRNSAMLPPFGSIHPDMTLSGNTAVYEGFPGGEAEYLFFGLHEHDGKICGKAWHHEDRHDPGDMSKCYVRLALVDGDLHFHLRMKDGLPELDDPDFLSFPHGKPNSAADCDADAPVGKDWGEWVICVFTRKEATE